MPSFLFAVAVRFLCFAISNRVSELSASSTIIDLVSGLFASLGQL
jgi:hypothetical protein